MKWKQALTQQKNTSMLIWIWMILLVLHEGFGIDQPYREVKGTTCQEIVKQPNYQAGLPCTGKDVRYHCLLNEDYTKEYEVCREWKWIPKDKCAYFNTYGSGNVDERDCESIPGLPCADKEYNSADNTEYAVCYMKKEVTTIVPMQETSTRPDVTVDGGNATSSNSTQSGSNDQNGQHGEDIAAAIVFGLFVPPLTATLLFFIYRYKVKRKENSRRLQPTQENTAESESLLPSDIKNNLENQQNSRSDERLTAALTNISETEMLPSIENTENTQREREKDATNNSMTKCEDEEVKSSKSPSEDNTENTERGVRNEGHPFDGVETGEANSKDNKMSAESDRRGSLSDGKELPDKEESVSEKERSTLDEDVSDETADEKEGTTYTSDENKTESASENVKDPVQTPDEDEPTDVFDDTAGSLHKEIVDKSDMEFCQKLYEFLIEVFTKPARILLKSVLSKNVEKSPAEILEDASIQTELKEELPPEYHASISSEGEDNESVVILYYLLRKFLEEKDCPKSGWGKPVKSTDTGIGDDVERLHRVYTIIRETSDEGKIPVDGYQRLLKEVSDTFARLDSDNKLKDDHNKLFKKLQDIKNHQKFQSTPDEIPVIL